MGNDIVSLLFAAAMLVGVLVIIGVVASLMRQRNRRSYRNRR